MSSADPIFYVKVVDPLVEEKIDVSSRVISLVFDDEETKPDKLKLTVDNYDLTQLDALAWQHGAKIEVSWGYPGNMAPPRICSVQKITGSTVLQIECNDEAAAVLNKEQKVRTFENVKRSDVARQIANEMGIAIERQHIDDTEEVLEQVTQARMTDMALLVDMAKREGFEFYTDFDGFHFHPRQLGQKPTRKLEYFSGGAGDIISWTINDDIYKGGAKTGGATVVARDPKTKEDIVVKADNATQTDRTALAPVVVLKIGISARDGSATVIPPDTQNAHGSTASSSSTSAVVPSTETTKGTVTRQADGLYKKTQLAAVKLTLECKGDPNMLAKSVVEVARIGATVSGNYYVETVSHKVGDGYKMTVKVKRDGKSQTQGLGSGAQAATKMVPATGKVNTSKAPEVPTGAKVEHTNLDLKVTIKPDGSISYVDNRGRGAAP